MLPSLEGILKSTGKAVLDIVKEAHRYDDPSLSSLFDPSSNASLRAWGYHGNARDTYKSGSIVVYVVELIWDQGRCVINKVGQTVNLRERRKAESYQNRHLKSVLRL